jgi:2-amino-4-hydroxy-6-hydroxymethyldihydropteridine diphosphokinase
VTVSAVSPVYETTPVGVTGQPDYLNAVVLADTSWEAHALLGRGLELEALAGRVRPAGGSQHGPRPLDIDLIALSQRTGPFGSEAAAPPSAGPAGLVHACARLILPHPRAHKRAFVLAPWRDADPAATLAGRPVAEWLAAVPGQAVTRRDDLILFRPGGA